MGAGPRNHAVAAGKVWKLSLIHASPVNEESPGAVNTEAQTQNATCMEVTSVNSTQSTTDFVSHSELIAGLRAVTEAAKAALLLGRDTQRLAFALADAQRLIRRGESMLDRLAQPAVDPEIAYDALLKEIGVRQ